MFHAGCQTMNSLTIRGKLFSEKVALYYLWTVLLHNEQIMIIMSPSAWLLRNAQTNDGFEMCEKCISQLKHINKLTKHTKRYA